MKKELFLQIKQKRQQEIKKLEEDRKNAHCPGSYPRIKIVIKSLHKFRNIGIRIQTTKISDWY